MKKLIRSILAWAYVHIQLKRKTLTIERVNKDFFVNVREQGVEPSIRNALCFAIRKMRIENPYEPIDYSEIKQAYEDYFKSKGHIKSINEIIDNLNNYDIFITSISGRYPVKGEKYNNYTWEHTYGRKMTYKCKAMYNNTNLDDKIILTLVLKSIRTESDKYIGPNDITGFRYATTDEIEKFKTIEARYNFLVKEREIHESEIELIDEKISDLDDEFIDEDLDNW